MKKILVCFICCFAFSWSDAQVDTAFKKTNSVKIINWGARGVYFMGSFWEMARPQLAKKFSNDLVEKIITFSSTYKFPSGLDESISNDADSAKPNRNHLKMYFVGEFDNNTNGQFHNVEYILWLPANENKEWNTAVKWEQDVFILIPKDAVEFIKQ